MGGEAPGRASCRRWGGLAGLHQGGRPGARFCVYPVAIGLDLYSARGGTLTRTTTAACAPRPAAGASRCATT